MNLLTEIKQELKVIGKTLDDVVWVGCEQFSIPIPRFLELANTEYDRSFGTEEVATDLLIVGENWWLERHNYDGSEWFEYKTMPKKPSYENQNVFAVTRNQSKVSWVSTLEDMNDESGNL